VRVAEQSARYGSDIVDEDTFDMEFISQNLIDFAHYLFVIAGSRGIFVFVQPYGPGGGNNSKADR
jgi:hypothetical protein